MEDSPYCYVTWGRRLAARFPCNLAGFSARSTLALKDLEPPRRAPNLSPEPSPREARTCCRPRQPRRPSLRSPSRSTLWCATEYQASAERGSCVVKARSDFRQRQASVRITEDREATAADRHMRAMRAPVRRRVIPRRRLRGPTPVRAPEVLGQETMSRVRNTASEAVAATTPYSTTSPNAAPQESWSLPPGRRGC